MTNGQGLDAVKAATWDLHVKAERGGIIAGILAGRATRFQVALFLRNLLPVYRLLDASRFGGPLLARSAAIEADVRLLSPDLDPPLLPAGAAYAEQVARGTEAAVAHAYVRFLGDLNGGRILQRSLAACLGDIAGGLAFHAYPAIPDLSGFTRNYRTTLDTAVRAADFAAVRREAILSFEMNIALSDAVASWSRASPGLRRGKVLAGTT